MAHELFISHSSKDARVANAVCEAMEQNDIACWIAPRNILPGIPYGRAIIQAIEASKIMLLVLSSRSNHSRYVMREVERAVAKDLTIIPFRIEDVFPSEDLEFFLSTEQWFDALPPPVEQYLQRLAAAIKLLLAHKEEEAAEEFVPPPETGARGMIQPPPAPEAPPDPGEFVGRRDELAYYSAKLAGSHLAVISGMAGVGKTALAVKLAGQFADPEQVFWHTFRAGQGVDTLIWKLAGFLWWRGQQDLWSMLQGDSQFGGQPPLDVLLDYLFQMVQGQGHLLCLDDFQYVQDDPGFAELSRRLHDAAQTGDLDLLLVSRRRPDLVSGTEFETLSGLGAGDVSQLLATRKLSLPAELEAALFTHTGGNAQFLTLAIEALGRSSNPARLIGRLSEVDDLERYLMDQAYEGLTGEERDVMRAVAVLLGYPGTRDAIEAVMDNGPIRLVVRELCDRNLLTASQGAEGREYAQHTMVRAFYYDLSGRRQRQAMHLRAGEYYQAEEPDALRAALHFEQAGEVERAARLATDDVWSIACAGQAQPLGQLLHRLAQKPLADDLLAEVHLGLGRILLLTARFDEAGRHLERAYQLFKDGDSQSDWLSAARACYQIGRLYERRGGRENLDEALAWQEKGLALLPERPTAEAAMLHMLRGIVAIRSGDLTKADEASEKALALARQTGAKAVLAMAHRMLSISLRAQGRLDQALEHCQAGTTIDRELSNWFDLAKDHLNRGVLALDIADWSQAVEADEAAIEIFERLGAGYQLGITLCNLGDKLRYLGQVEEGIKHAQRGLGLFTGIQSQQGMIFAHAVLGPLYWRGGDLDRAAEHLLAARRLIEEQGAAEFAPSVGRWLAQVYLDRGDLALAEAEIEAMRARPAEKLGEDAEPVQRLWGQVLAARGEIAQAEQVLQESLDRLAQGGNRYQTAVTQAALAGVVAQVEGRTDAARALAMQAHKALDDLGARLEAEETAELLASLDG